MKPTNTIVIFGASGDLTQRKLVPALFSLYRKGRLPADVKIVGYARRPYTNEEFRTQLRDGVKQFAASGFDATMWESFSNRLFYTKGDLGTPSDFENFQAFLKKLENGPANRLYYLATSPDFYGAIVKNLGSAGLANEEEVWRRIVIEKPFGHDLDTALKLTEEIQRVFEERQIYRIDHYLGKETAQNILFFRFANTIFELVWNRNYIDNVQITVAESVDVGHRAGYYDQSGVLRDMFQNHILQLLALVAMEPPASFNADVVRNEKVKVLSAIRPLDLKETVRAQYKGYRQAEGVAPNSQTPTYAALKLNIDNWRWKNIPFYLRSGKALAKKNSEIVIEFNSPPHVMFNLAPGKKLMPNMLSLKIQPDEGIHLKFETKVPDSALDTRSVDMDFHYSESFGKNSLPDAYERLLIDAVNGDASLFTRSDEIENAWKLIDPIVKGWETQATPALAMYESGTWGPIESDQLLARDGRQWRSVGDH